MSETLQLKILLVGSLKAGKTAISNFLAGNKAEVELSDYHPTVGVRIVEFEREITVSGHQKKTWQGNHKVQVQLWDCSGDRKYESGWPALLHNANGVILVFNPENRNAEKELENWHTRFVANAGLKDNQCLIFAHNSSGADSSAAKVKPKLSKSLAKITVINTSLDYDADTIKYEFDYLLQSIAKSTFEKRDTDELNIMNG